MSRPSRGPRLLSDTLGELFAVRGYGRLWARHELENAWNATVGEPFCHQTRLGEVQYGVLSVTVAHSAVLEQLVSFRKGALLEALRSRAPATAIRDIRFRVGVIVPEVRPPGDSASSSSDALADGRLTSCQQGAAGWTVHRKTDLDRASGNCTAEQ